MPQTAHLWKPGISANPLGRAAEVQRAARTAEVQNRIEEKRFTNALLDVLKEPTERQPKRRKTKLLAVVAKLVDMALDGDIQAHKMIADRIEGAVPFLQGPTGYGPNGAGLTADGSPLVLVVKWGSPAQQPVDDIPMLELKAVGSTEASTAAPEEKPSDTKDLASS